MKTIFYKSSFFRNTLLLFFAFTFLSLQIQAKVLYVDGINGNNSVTRANNNGWSTAWKDLVHALYWAQANDEIWLNTGTYVPIQTGFSYVDARAQSFWTHSNIKIYGGFSIVSGATSFGQRNPAAYPVFLSGENQNDGIESNNSYTVIRTYYNNGFSVLDGVTVTGANNTTIWGGGLNITNCSPTINNCIFSGNRAMRGAGILVDRTSGLPCNPTITNCSFSTNTADWGGGIYNAGCQPTISLCNFISNGALVGSAIYNDEKLSTPGSAYITNCAFSDNTLSAPYQAAAIYEYHNASQILNCTFSNNAGGAIKSLYATGVIDNTLFTSNGSVSIDGGALMLEHCGYTISNSSFTGNTGSMAGAIDIEDLITSYPFFYLYVGAFAKNTIVNCLIRNNNGEGITTIEAATNVINCTIAQNNGDGILTSGSNSLKRPLIQNTICRGNGFRDFYFEPGLNIANEGEPPVFLFDEGQPYIQNCLFLSFEQGFDDGIVPKEPINLGGNIIGVDPLLEPDFTLNSCSPAINAGNNSLLPSPFNATDRAGNPRFYQGGTVDMGCFEKQSAVGGSLTYNSTVYVCNGDSILIHGVYEKSPGTYSSSTALPNGCVSIDNVTLVVRPKPTVHIRSLNNCATSGTIEVIPTSGQPPFQCVLDGDTISNLALEASAAFLNKANGTFTFSVSDANGCAPSINNFIHYTYGNIVPNILYVDANATGNKTGLSWSNAFTSLQDALNHVSCGATEIWVSEGTYIPTQDPSGAYVTTPFATFLMQNNLKISGGFSTAHGATSLATRNYTLYPTILSGDIQLDGINTNNAYNVVNNYNTSLNNTSVLDGFIIRDAYNNITGVGGGMINNGSSPKIENCVFINNYAVSNGQAKGGGMYNGAGSAPIISNCQFLNNIANGANASFGGAIANDASSPSLLKCIFNENLANTVGGAMYSYAGANIVIDNCLFVNNNVTAICSDGNAHQMNNCTITKNSGTTSSPGGLYCLANSSFITNTIIYGNTNGSVGNYSVSGSAPNYFYCDIEGSGGSSNWNTNFGINYGANKDENPRLSSTFQLGLCSPAINAGTPGYSSLTTDLNNNTRNYFGIDMGCYEKQSNVSYSGVVFVDANATGANTGLNWTDAFTDLQSALDLTCYPVTEIWVSKGTYVPSKDPSGNITNGNGACFRMRNNLAIYGGFSVADGAINFTLRNPEAYKTILSGDIQKDGIQSNNVFNVINNYETNLNLTAVLDGFTVSDAYNTFDISGGTGITWGAGVINKSSSPLFKNCMFRDNTNASLSSAFGGGVYNKDCSPEFYQCKFIHNITSGSFVSYGAGMANINSNVVVKQCVFDDNNGIGPNSVGGGLYNSSGSLTMENCLLVNNIGGAICVDGTSFDLKNSTITQNTGTNQNAGGILLLACNPIISNTIIYNNPGGSVTNISALPTFAYSDIEGSGAPANWNTSYGVNYGANKDVDPLFTSTYNLTTCSPAVDFGTPAFGISTTDLSNNNRFVGLGVDMGCYEFNGPFSSSYGTTVYVDVNASGTKSGLSWTNAFTNLQDALDITNCTNVNEIWVSKGTYYPSKNSSGARVNDASACFMMKNNVTIKGGFSISDGATTLASRNYALFTTILSGDVQQDGMNGNNAWNVINNYQTGVNNSAVLDGFMITKAYNSVNGIGGGVINANTSPTFLNCIFHDNFAGGTNTARGAGMHNQQGAQPYINNCSFSYNYTSGIANAFGSGMSNDNSTPLIGRCKFIGNVCAAPNAAGGGIYCNGGSPITIDNCFFTDNNAAAILSDGNNVVLNNVTITNNTPTPTSVAGGLCFIACNPSIYNSIIYNNIGGSVQVYSGIPTFAYSDIQGSGAPLSWNPIFGVNYGANIDIAPNWNTEFKPYPCSPTVNAGTAAFGISPNDLDGNPRIYGISPDMGCYEAGEPNHGIIDASICAGTYYIFPLIPGAYYNLPGTYNINMPSAAQGGCDSLVVLNLTVKPTSASSITITSCGNYTWNGTVYTTSGVKTYITTNAIGCDSVATLNLTINQASSSTQQVNACTNYIWNGTVYTNSGVKTYTTTNAVGCDSTAYLDLTILTPTTSLTSSTNCSSYVWNGNTYTTSGTYTYISTGVNGCDSTAYLDLNIKSTSASNSTIETCSSYVWNGSTYTASGLYTNVSTNSVGCDSIATLDLQILTPQNQSFTALEDTICNGNLATINLSNTETNVDYTLINMNDNAPLSYAQMGSGSSMSLISNTLSSNVNIGIRAKLITHDGIHFDGINDYLSGSFFPINSENGTWSSWISKDDWTAFNDDRLFSNGVNYTDNNSFYISLHPGVGFHFRYGGINNPGNGIATYDKSHFSSFAPKSWHHLAATWNTVAGTTTLVLFVDGVQVSSGTATCAVNFPPPIYLSLFGSGGSGTPYFGPGRMENIQLWSVAKSAQELRSMSTYAPGPQPNLIGFWTLNGITTTGNQIISNSAGSSQLVLLQYDCSTCWSPSVQTCPTTFTQSIPITVSPCNQVNLKLFLQGYYTGSDSMTTTLLNEGVSANGSITDSVIVELHDVQSPYSMVTSCVGILQTNGLVEANFIGSYSGTYYVVVRHRNHIETWTSTPLTLISNSIYDFTNSASKAFGDNQSEVESGVWALYSGDINQDENIDLIDASLLEADINNFEFGYFVTDINGDGNVDLLDSPNVEDNINNFVFSVHP